MRTQIQLNISGKVRIFKGDIRKDNLKFTKSNSIQPGALKIICKSILRYVSSTIDTITVYDSSNVALGSCQIAEDGLDYNATTNEATFTGVFSSASFTGTIASAKLSASGISEVFAELTGLDIPKENTPLSFQWTIKID